MSSLPLPIHGRGAGSNPPNRFDPIELEPDLENIDPLEPAPLPQTQYFRDTSRTVIAHNDSPDVGFEYSINPYRGCEHGCTYCYARPTHEYLSLSAGIDFETKIFVKHDASELLRKELTSEKWTPQTISISGVTDCYQPAERRFQITRKCLEVLAEFRNPLGIITKSFLVARDIDILSKMAEQRLAAVFLSITSLDNDIAMKMEPRASSPARRLEAIAKLSGAGIPCGVMVAPIIPGLTDHEIPSILAAAAQAGAITCGYTIVRLPFAVKDIFEEWLTNHFPDRKEKILNRIRNIRGGKLNESEFHARMRGQGEFAGQFEAMFNLAKRRAGLDKPFPHLSSDAFRRPGGQMGLWPA
jgi:DNA repair photolyase